MRMKIMHRKILQCFILTLLFWKSSASNIEKNTAEASKDEIGKITDQEQKKLMNLSIEYGKKRKNYIQNSVCNVRNVLQLQRVFFWLMVLLHEKCGTAPPLILKMILSYTGSFLTPNTIKCHYNKITALCCSLDHSFLFSGASNHTTNDIKMWDIGAGTCLRVFHGPIGMDNITGLAISRDNKTLVSCSSRSSPYDAMVQIWNTTTGKEYYRVFTSNVAPTACSFFSNDKFLLIGYYPRLPDHAVPDQSTIQIISVVDRVVLCNIPIQPTLEYARLNDDRIVTMIGHYRNNRIEVINNGVVQYSFPSTNARSGGFVKTGDYYIGTTKKGRMMVSQSVLSGETTIIMNINLNNDYTHRNVTAISSDTNNRLVATSHNYNDNEYIDIWDIQACQCIKRIVLEKEYGCQNRNIDNTRFFTEDLNYFICGDFAGNAHIYSTNLQ